MIKYSIQKKNFKTMKNIFKRSLATIICSDERLPLSSKTSNKASTSILTPLDQQGAARQGNVMKQKKTKRRRDWKVRNKTVSSCR